MRAASLTLLALAGAVLAWTLPQLPPLLIYDREAILAGEVWRLFTGHWVHFTARHLAFDLAVLGVVGLILESRRDPHWPRVLLLAPWLIGGGLLVCEPRLSFYGGLSGVATAAVVCLALAVWQEGSRVRWAGAVVLGLFAAKTILEWQTGRALFAGSLSGEFVASPLSHLLGGLSAVVLGQFPPGGTPGKEKERGPVIRAPAQSR